MEANIDLGRCELKLLPHSKPSSSFKCGDTKVVKGIGGVASTIFLSPPGVGSQKVVSVYTSSEKN
jgi:hypothetical protein